MKIVIYDCEIKRGIPARGEDRVPGIEYCNGWGDHAGMGVSVTGVYEYGKDAYRVFCDDNVGEMLLLFANADLLVGFNSLNFDDRLLGATYPGFNDITTERYDILVEIWRAAGLKPGWGSPKTHGGFGLDEMCAANFDERKTGHGAMAPVNWQLGKRGTVIDYCLNDVRMTKLLLDAVISGYPLVNPKGGTLSLLKPDGVGVEEPDDEEVKMQRCGECNMISEVGEDLHTFDCPIIQQKKPAVTQGSVRWEDLTIEYEQLLDENKYMVAVHGSEGLIVTQKLEMDA